MGDARQGQQERQEQKERSNFIRTLIRREFADGQRSEPVATRFPPHPNGHLHIGHAKSICLNFGLARDFPGATCNLRFDDTNPERESTGFVESIQEDVRWLGFQWNGEVRYASDYFEQLYDIAEHLIRHGLAYVCDLPAEEIRDYRGTLTEPGRASPSRDRSADESLALLRAMRRGDFADGARTLRARIDMASPNMQMRDPVLYRIRHTGHHRTGDAWCIYPTYDFAHCLSDAIEGITHSLCSLEFEEHRPLYDWLVDKAPVQARPRQIEFARLNISHCLMSKRKLGQLVESGAVNGWDDPRLPTIKGLRRRGYSARAIRDFCEGVGVARAESTVDMAQLEAVARADLDVRSPRAMAVLRPLKLVILNWPEEQTREITVANHPRDEGQGTRSLHFARELYIERDDFALEPPPGYKRLAPGRAVRLRGAYVIRFEEVILDADGQPLALHCICDLDTLGANPQGYKPSGVIHWLSAAHSVRAEVRLYDRLFSVAEPEADSECDFSRLLNPHSLEVLDDCRVESWLADVPPEARFQFERLGYFVADSAGHRPDHLLFNRTVSLRDGWAKRAGRPGDPAAGKRGVVAGAEKSG